jgi:hypothetical protein
VLSYCHKALHWLEKLYWQKLAAVVINTADLKLQYVATGIWEGEVC